MTTTSCRSSNNKDRVLIILAGLPGTGKTTLARYLAASLGAVHIRVDSLEQAIRQADPSMVGVGELGYVTGYTLARENLIAGRTVVADSVNPVQVSRDAWRAVGDDCKVGVVEIEVMCSDSEEHRNRVEQRPADIPGLVLPTWAAVRAREYHPWTRDRIVIDTSGRSPQESARDLAERVSSSKPMTGILRAAVAGSIPQSVTNRFTVLDQLAAEIRCILDSGVTFVGIDGVDGAGKTYFADELAARFSDLEVIRSSVDDFHNPRAIRYVRGKHSPEGFFHDSFDYQQLRVSLLDPLSASGTMRYRTAVFDHRTDEPVDSPTLNARPPAILILDGIFLHRPELAAYWNYSVFLDVNRRESLRRWLRRDGHQGVSDDPSDPVHNRYVRGPEIYMESCNPKAHATRVVNNDDLEHPYVDG